MTNQTVHPPQSTDWAEVRRRIDEFGAVLEKGFVPSLEDERRQLKARAQQLARQVQAADSAEATLEVIEFELASEFYAFPLSQVRTVSALKELTPVPCTPNFVLGVINLRGEIHTVVDLKKFFDLPDRGITELNKIIIIHHDDMQLGILADAVRGVHPILLQDLDPVMPTLTGIRADYLRGVTRDRLVVLDAVRILSDQRILVAEEVSP